VRGEDDFLFMWDRAVEALLAAERGRRRIFRLLAGSRETCAWEPPMDVYEFPERYRITMGLPGIDPKSIRVARVGQGLRVTASRPVELFGEVRIRRLEIPRGIFQRDIDLPPGEFAVESCNFANGCLIIDLVKTSGAQR
jgi:HSP20 family molecular chaperone IbpA